MQRPNLKSPDRVNNVINNATDHKKLSPKSPVRPITRVPPASSSVLNKKIASAKVSVVSATAGVKAAGGDTKAVTQAQKNNVNKSSLVTALQTPPKHVLSLQQVPNVNHVQPTVQAQGPGQKVGTIFVIFFFVSFFIFAKRVFIVDF